VQFQSAENWTVLVEFAATASGPVHIAWRNLLALSGHVDPTARHSNELGSDFDSLRAAFAILWNVRLDRRNSASFERLYRIWIWPAAILKTKIKLPPQVLWRGAHELCRLTPQCVELARVQGTRTSSTLPGAPWKGSEPVARLKRPAAGCRCDNMVDRTCAKFARVRSAA